MLARILDLGMFRSKTRTFNAATRAILPEILSLLPLLRILHLGGRTNIDIPLSSAIHEHQHLTVATIEFARGLLLTSITMPSLPRIRLKKVHIHGHDWISAEFHYLKQYMLQGISLNTLHVSAPAIIQNGFGGLVFPGLRYLKIGFRATDFVILSWLPAFITAHTQLAEIKLQEPHGDYEGSLWRLTPHFPWGRTIIEAVRDMHLTDAFSLPGVTIGSSCSHIWTVCALSLTISRSVSEVLAFINSHCPAITSLSLATASDAEEMNPVGCASVAYDRVLIEKWF